MLPDELHVGPVTLAAAQVLLQKCAWVDFTSGRRSWLTQAHAMAVNVATKRDWVGLVYKKEPELQAWVDAHPDVVDVDGLASGLYGVLMSLPASTRARFAHPAGRAFDLRVPTGPWQEPTITAIHTLDGLETFLQGEGGLPVWHCSFKEPYVGY